MDDESQWVAPCFCLRPENWPSVFAFFCVVICWGAGVWGGRGVITSCVYVIIDFLWRTHFMLRCTLKVLGGGWGGGRCNNVLCLRDHRFFFGEHTKCYVANFCFGQGVGRGGAITSCVYVIIDFLMWTHFMLPCIRNYTYVLMRWPHFMLRCTRVFQFGERTSCDVAHVFFNSVKNDENTSFYVACVCFFGEHT